VHRLQHVLFSTHANNRPKSIRRVPQPLLSAEISTCFVADATGVLGVAGRFDDGEESPIGGEQEKHKFSLNVTLGVGVWELGLDIVPEEPTLVSLSGALAAPLRLVSSANQSPDAA